MNLNSSRTVLFSILTVLFLTLCPLFSAAADDDDLNNLYPNAGCYNFDSEGANCTGYFSYSNYNELAVNLPISANNSFSAQNSSINPDQGQGTLFVPGSHYQAEDFIAVTWNCSNNEYAQWQLGNSLATIYTAHSPENYAYFSQCSVYPKFDCIIPNLNDQNYTAYFSYYSGSPASVVIPLGAENSFIPAALDGVQPTEFLYGVNLAAFSVPWNGADPLSWTLASAYGPNTVGPLVEQNENQENDLNICRPNYVNNLVPIADCKVENNDGTVTYYFGYQNENPYPVIVEVGTSEDPAEQNYFKIICDQQVPEVDEFVLPDDDDDDNNIDPECEDCDQGQPTRFEVGRSVKAFGVTVPNNCTVIWNLFNSQFINYYYGTDFGVANSDLPLCQAPSCNAGGQYSANQCFNPANVNLDGSASANGFGGDIVATPCCAIAVAQGPDQLGRINQGCKTPRAREVQMDGDDSEPEFCLPENLPLINNLQYKWTTNCSEGVFSDDIIVNPNLSYFRDTEVEAVCDVFLTVTDACGSSSCQAKVAAPACGCDDQVIKPTLFALDGGTNTLNTFVRRATHSLNRAAKAEGLSFRKFIKKTQERANALKVQSWGVVWSFPEVVATCVVSSFCVNYDNTPKISTYNTDSSELLALIDSVLDKKKSFTLLSTADKKLLKSASKVHQQNLDLSAEIPAVTSVCS